MKDLYSDIKVTNIYAPKSATATGSSLSTVGTGGFGQVDMAGYDSCTFVISSAAQTTDTLTVIPIVMESATSDGTFTAVANGDMTNTEASANLSSDAGAYSASKIGYIGSKRYVTCLLSIANAATGFYSVVAVQHGARVKPVS